MLSRRVAASSRVPSPQEVVDSLRGSAPYEVEIPFDFRATGVLQSVVFLLQLFKTDPNYECVIRRFRYELFNPEVAELWRIGPRVNGTEVPGPFRVGRYTSTDIPGASKGVAGNGFMPREAMRGEEEQGFVVDGGKQLTLSAECVDPALLAILPGEMAPAGICYVAGMQFSREVRNA